MKPLFWVGLVVLVLGLGSLFYGIPRRETHGVSVGDASVGVQTRSSQKLSPVVSGIIILAGAVMMAAGARRKAT